MAPDLIARCPDALLLQTTRGGNGEQTEHAKAGRSAL